MEENVETSYFTQLKICYLMTTFRCPSDILITSWLFTARWSTWPGNHLVPYVAELVRSCIQIHAHRCLHDPKFLLYPSFCRCASLLTSAQHWNQFFCDAALVSTFWTVCHRLKSRVRLSFAAKVTLNREPTLARRVVDDDDIKKSSWSAKQAPTEQ